MSAVVEKVALAEIVTRLQKGTVKLSSQEFLNFLDKNVPHQEPHPLDRLETHSDDHKRLEK
ncbi:MAG: hypothetical protein ACO2ZM_02200 [Francisellaceae bacterium]